MIIFLKRARLPLLLSILRLIIMFFFFETTDFSPILEEPASDYA